VGRRFGWLWGAYAVSAIGSSLALNAFSLIAVLALHAGPAEVAALAAAGFAAGAVLAVPLGPVIETRRKRPVMIGMDLVRFAALGSIPIAYAVGGLAFPQLLVVAVLVGVADIAFGAASGAFLKGLVPADRLLAANGRFESTNWTALALGPPLGGVAIGVFGPVATMVADAVSYLLSALGVTAVGGPETRPAPIARGPRLAGVLAGWRYIWARRELRRLFLNTVLVNALILAGEPLLSVLMLGRLGFAPWEYGLAFAVPCLGGLLGARLSGRLVDRFGRGPVLLVSGALRVCWPVGLAFIGPGIGGLLLVMGIELALIGCIGVYNPILATYRLEQTPPELVARVLTAWSVTGKAVMAGLTAGWGVLAGLIGLRPALAAAGLLLLATPWLLPRRADSGTRTEDVLGPAAAQPSDLR
jgi:MFS family permease